MQAQSIVHESEAQRRHARVRIPATLVIEVDGKPSSLSVQDLSASGFSLKDDTNLLSIGSHKKGALKFNFDGVDIAVNINFQVVSEFGESKKRLGCEFHDLGEKETSTIRLVITKFLAGDMTTSGDVIHILNRDNFAKARAKKSSAALTGKERVKALMGTTIVFLIGVLAFAFIMKNVYNSFFVTKATAGVIATESIKTVAPREGYVELLVKPGEQVTKGQLIATVDSPMLDVLAPGLQSTGVSEDELKAMIGNNVGAAIKSPCDCKVIGSGVNGAFYLKGDAVLTLAALDSTPSVMARFEFKSLESLHIGQKTYIELSDGKTTFTGVIDKITVPDEFTVGDKDDSTVVVKIATNETVSTELINQPVTVQVEDF